MDAQTLQLLSQRQQLLNQAELLSAAAAGSGAFLQEASASRKLAERIEDFIENGE